MSAEAVQVSLLGPVGVSVAGSARPVSGLRRKAVLAVLGLQPGTVVSTDRLVDIVWGDRPPATVGNALQNIVSYLRRVLGRPGLITGSAAGYTLQVPPEAVDLGRAEVLIRRGGDPAERAADLRTALGLWHGETLSDVVTVPWLGEQSRRLEQLRTDAVEALCDARLALGEHADLVAELTRMVGRNPFRERLHEQLMIALYRCGRQAEALDVLRRLRRSMAEELGVEPGPSLRATEQAILRHDPALAQVPVVAAAPGRTTGTPVPAQLPRAIPGFVGRAAELARLDDLAGADQPVVVVSGAAGVGKTALALQWSRANSPRFPDGQLYVNLRGFDPSGTWAGSAEAMSGFLIALGVPPRDAPVTLDEQAALLRTRLAGKRMLIVLDNARDEGQVRALLPGTRGCLVLVTSRNRLDGLVVSDGAQAVRLDVPDAGEARRMLAYRLGAHRVEAEPAAVDDIVARCARLPLALAVAAAHPAATGTSLAVLAGLLRDAAGALPQLRTGDVATDVQAVLSWSIDALSEPAARLFRLLGLCPGPDSSVTAAAALAGLPVAETAPLLAELVRFNLLAEPAPGRFACHDLSREFAMRQAVLRHGEDERADAEGRLRDHYLHTAFGAAMLIRPTRAPIELAAPRRATIAVALAGKPAANAWIEAELPVLISLVRQDTGSTGFRPWQLAWCLATFLERNGRWLEFAAMQQDALATAERSGDRLGQAFARQLLARMQHLLGRHEESDDHYRVAARLFAAEGELIGQGSALNGLSISAEARGRYPEALAAAREVFAVYEKAGYRFGMAAALNNMGFVRMRLGEYAAARDLCERALALYEELGDSIAAAEAWDSLARVHFRLGARPEGVASYQRAIAGYAEIGDRYHQANSLASLGDEHASAGDRGAARRAWQEALRLLEEIKHPESEGVRARLSGSS